MKKPPPLDPRVLVCACDQCPTDWDPPAGYTVEHCSHCFVPVVNCATSEAIGKDRAAHYGMSWRRLCMRCAAPWIEGMAERGGEVAATNDSRRTAEQLAEARRAVRRRQQEAN